MLKNMKMTATLSFKNWSVNPEFPRRSSPSRRRKAPGRPTPRLAARMKTKRNPVSI